MPRAPLFSPKRLLRPPPRAALEILLYHFVTDQDTPFSRGGHVVSLREFENQLRFLASNFQIIRLREVPQLNAARFPGRRFAAVCFDDGYRSNLTEAYPILEKLGIPATIFLNSSVIDNQDLLWRDKIRLIIENGWEKAFIDYLHQSPCHQHYHFKRLGKRSMYAWTKDPRSVRMDSIQKDISGFLAQGHADTAGLARKYDLFLHSDDIGPNAILDFGNHTHTHPVLTGLDKVAQHEEIHTCHRFITSRGLFPVGLAVPFHPYNRKTLSICRHLDYTMVFTEADQANPMPLKAQSGTWVLKRRMAPQDAASLVQKLGRKTIQP